MSRLTEILRQLEDRDPDLARDLRREVDALQERRAFGLNFERHTPEAVELPGRPVRRGDKVRIVPPRGEPRDAKDEQLYVVASISRSPSGPATAHLNPMRETVDDEITLDDVPERTANVDDLVVVAEFRDPIYPGLISTGKVERGGAAPYHTVINGENYHALQTLLFSHRGKIDAIYIDPPYNTGAKDWKYNNDYVEGDDLYRHSKWLAMMERRLLLAKELLNPDDSVLIVTIDEKEYLRLGLLLEQIFPDANIQMISINISSRGTSRFSEFSRVNEFIYFVMLGNAYPVPIPDKSSDDRSAMWQRLRRDEDTSARSAGRPGQFYPIFVNQSDARIVGIGAPVPPGTSRDSVTAPPGAVAVFPLRKDGTEMVWGVTAKTLESLIDDGFVRVTSPTNEHQPYHLTYLRGVYKNIDSGRFKVTGRRPDGSAEVVTVGGKAIVPQTVWNNTSHDAGFYGTGVVRALLPNRRFPFPKSLYAVEDALRFFVANKPNAVVLDFFAGSGTTAHAVMRLNKQDGGHRQAILVTNNEVSADEAKALVKDGLRPGDPGWESRGICEWITKPRVTAAITGLTLDGDPIRGDYKFTDEFPMADGFAANAEFFNLTYEAPLRVATNRGFGRIAPLLWLRAGSQGPRIDHLPKRGWDVAERYGVIKNLTETEEFVAELTEHPGLQVVFIITDEDRLFEIAVAALPEAIDVVRLYESYLRNFELETLRATQ